MARHSLLSVCGLLLACAAPEAETDSPTVSILAPADGSTHPEGDVSVAVVVEHFLLGYADTAVGWKLPSLLPIAHAHVDDATPTGFVALHLNGLLIDELETTTSTLQALGAGDHQLEVKLLLEDRTPLVPAVSDSAIFSVANER